MNVEANVRMLTILAVAILAACAGPAGADGQKVTISKAVADSFESYKAEITSIGVGAFAITEDGMGGAGAGCPKADCLNRGKVAQMAIERCEKVNSGHTCQLFARNREAVLPYEIAQ